MQYPIQLTFKLLTLGQRISATDAKGHLLMFIKQKMLRLKEKVEVYSDEAQSSLLFTVEADRMIDFSANYRFTGADGSDWGSVRRKGMRSLWSAHYQVTRGSEMIAEIHEENPLKKVLESVLSEIPILGFLAVYFLNPSYLVTGTDGSQWMRLTKEPAFWEGKFKLDKLTEMSEDDELRCLLSLLMLVLLEKKRG